MSSSLMHQQPGSSSATRLDSGFPAHDADEHGNTHWISRAAFPVVVTGLFASQAALALAVFRGWFWLAIPLVLLSSHFMHGVIIGFHEASHGLLRKSRLLNEWDGILAGTLSFMSFSLYRAAHQTHHSHLATERDVELWPFVIVDSPRWLRRLAAFLELNFGLFYSPCLFARVFFQRNSPIRSRKVRRRIWMEFALIGVFWSGVIFSVVHWNLWSYFLWLYLAPAIIAGNLQSWRKYIEHVGLSGDTAKSATRSIVADTWSGRLFSLTLLHEPYHGVHHLKVGLPHAALPRNAGLLTPTAEGELAPFPSYRSALMDLLRQLPDPRSGSHWPQRTLKPN